MRKLEMKENRSQCNGGSRNWVTYEISNGEIVKMVIYFKDGQI